MLHAGTIFSSIIWSQQLLFCIVTISCVLKLYFLAIIVRRCLTIKKLYHPWSFAVGILLGSVIGDVAWEIKIIQHLWIPTLPYSVITFFIRIAWGFAVVQYQSIALFMQSLMEKNFRPHLLQKILFPISALFACYFFYIAFFEPGLTNELEREVARQLIENIPLEIRMIRYTVLYLLNMLMIPGLYITFEKMRTHNLPKLLRKQLIIFIRYLLFPYIMTEFIQISYIVCTPLQPYMTPVVSISTMLLIYATYYCMSKVICLHFSSTDHPLIIPTTSMITVHNIKTSIDILGTATSTQELGHIVQTFFHQTYVIPARYVSLHIRSAQVSSTPHLLIPIEQHVEEFLSTMSTDTERLLEHTQILSYDDISFDQFYEHSSEFNPILTLFDTITADIFIPIYVKRKMVAYITITRNARGPHASYAYAELTEMLLFANYLGNVITILQHHGLEAIAQESLNLKDTAHSKQQEISLLKESIRFCINNKISAAPGSSSITTDVLCVSIR